MKLFDYSDGKLFFSLHGMDGRQFFAEKNLVVANHQNVRDAHQLAQHLPWRFANPYVIVEALTHFLRPVESFEDGLQTRYLLRLPFLLLEVPANHDIKKLICGAQFDIRADHHRIPTLQDRILQLVKENRQTLLHPGFEIIALQHLLESYPAI